MHVIACACNYITVFHTLKQISHFLMLITLLRKYSAINSHIGTILYAYTISLNESLICQGLFVLFFLKGGGYPCDIIKNVILEF